MVMSNELSGDSFINTAVMMFDLVLEIYQTLGIRIEMIDLGGGIGIPYRPEKRQAVDLDLVGQNSQSL